MTDKKTPDTISQAQAAEAKPKRPYPGKERIPFPLSGPDHFFLFNLGGLALLEKTTDEVVGRDWHGTGSTCFHEAEKLLLAGNIQMIRAAIDAGLKTTDEAGKVIPVASVDLDEIEWPVGEIVEAALNALAVAYHNKRYDTLLAEVTAALEALNQNSESGEAA